MNIVIILIVISLFIALCFLGAFIWAVIKGQYDDSYTPSIKLLIEEDMISENDREISN